MEQIYKKYPDDKEAAIFYALSLDAAADPADKSFADQKKAGSILNAFIRMNRIIPGSFTILYILMITRNLRK